MKDACIALDDALRVTAWNRAAERVYGITATTAIGQRFSDLISAEPPTQGDTLAGDSAPRAMGLVDGPATHYVGSGRAISVRVTVIPLAPASGGAHRSLAIVSDDPAFSQMVAMLEQRVAAETLISTLSARFSELSEDQVDAEIELWLRRLVEFLGVDRGTFAELTDRGFLVTHSYAGPAAEPYAKGLANRSLPWLTAQFAARRVVVLPRIPDDLPDDAHAEREYMTASGMRSGIGIPVAVGDSVVCVLTFGSFSGPRDWPADVIARLRLAGEVLANAIVRRTTKQRLEQQRHELAHVGRVAAMCDLAAVIAHELDQPLTAVVSNAEAVRYLLRTREPDLGEADETLKDVIDAAMRVSEIVKRERRLLRKSQPTIEPVDLNEAVREIELFIRAEARQEGVRVTIKLQPGLPAIPGDRVQLQQVILNVARNALQAMRVQPTGTREMTIRTAAEGGEVVLTTIDAGPPIQDPVLARMFEPFFTTKTNGLGVGLSISKSIVDAHRGRIWASRNPGNGVTVHVAIPYK
jgi:signal transduction histidine kinase